MEFKIDATSEENSNLILRAIWSSIREQYGSCNWNFIPTKIPGEKGKTHYHLGWFSTKENEISGEVILISEKKAIVSSIRFPDIEKKYEDSIKELIENCKNSKKRLNQYRLAYRLEGT